MASWRDDPEQVKDTRAALNALTEQFDAAAKAALARHEMWVCPTCGENPAPMNFRCGRCTASLEQDRLNRELGQ